MTDLTLTDALAEVKPHSDWNGAHFLPTLFRAEIRDAIATILNAVLSGDLIPRADAEMAVAEVQRLREERDQAVRGRNEWRDDFKALAAAVVGDTGLSAMTVAAQARTFRPRAERAEAERDAALARVEKLRHQVTEASDPDFLFGAMDNVNDMDVTLDQFAAAASRAIRAALDEDARHG